MDLKRTASKEENESSGNNKKAKLLENVMAAYGCRQGEREEMQDFHVISKQFDIGKSFLTKSGFFAVFDGHAGGRAAEYCQQNMENEIRIKLEKSNELAEMMKSMKSVFVEAYKKVDEGFIAKAKAEKPAWKDGTTATTMLLFNNILYVANIGDSRAIVARRKPDTNTIIPLSLTTDHSPMVHEERMRIQKCGGMVKDGRINGIIEVSRSIGDLAFKNLGVICQPDLKKLTLTENDLFAIIGCDGVWKSFSNQEAVNFVFEKMEKLQKDDMELQPNESREEAEIRICADLMAAEAVRRKCGDNVSVIIVKL